MTLSQTAALTKKVIVISIITIVVATISFISYNIWHAYYLAHLPPVVEKPDPRFGILPAINLPPSKVSPSTLSYSVDTATGNLPTIGVDAGFEKFIKVYFVTKTFASLLSSVKSHDLADKFQIATPPQILSETNYVFKDNNKTLNVDLDSGNFSYTNQATISGTEALDNDNKLIADFNTTLQGLGVLKPDLQNGRSKILLFRNEGTNLIPTDVRTEASAAQISLWPASIDNKPIMTSSLDTSLINAKLYKSASDLQNYFSLNYTYYPIDTSTFATYPIKTPDSALTDLKSGKGVILLQPPKTNVSILKVYLAYFLPETYSPYLQPVFVFEGPQFEAYVPAISDEFQSQTK